MSKLASKFVFAGLFVLIMVGAYSCNKNKECKAVITVLDLNGNPLAGALVELDQGDVHLEQSTDGGGKANFETDLPMILDISVNGVATGKVARFEEGKTDNVTVP